MTGGLVRPRIAVLINNYNNGAHLRTCLESVYAQTRPPDEIVVFDDGSDDGGAEYLRSQGDRIRLLETRHDHARSGIENQAHAIRASLRATDCDWVALLDGDDAFTLGKLARVEREILKATSEVVLIQSTLQREREDGGASFVFREPSYHVEDTARGVERVGDCDFFYPTSALVLRRASLDPEVVCEAIDSIPGLAADSRLCIASIFVGTAVTIDEPLAIWRLRRSSVSSVFSRDQFHLLRHTLRRARFYNLLARRHGRAPLRPWRVLRTYQRLLIALLPLAVGTRVRNARARASV